MLSSHSYGDISLTIVKNFNITNTLYLLNFPLLLRIDQRGDKQDEESLREDRADNNKPLLPAARKDNSEDTIVCLACSSKRVPATFPRSYPLKSSTAAALSLFYQRRFPLSFRVARGIQRASRQKMLVSIGIRLSRGLEYQATLLQNKANINNMSPSDTSLSSIQLIPNLCL